MFQNSSKRCFVLCWIMQCHTSGDHSELRALRGVTDKDGAGGAHPKPLFNLLEVAAGSGWFSKYFHRKTQVKNEAEPWPRESIQAAPQTHLLLLSGLEISKKFLLVLLGVHFKKHRHTFTNVAQTLSHYLKNSCHLKKHHPTVSSQRCDCLAQHVCGCERWAEVHVLFLSFQAQI